MEKEVQLILDNLDFTGTRESWFDNWSTELDWEGEGNKSHTQKMHYLKLLLQFYNEAKYRLKSYPKEYQLWIEINEDDSSQNSVCIHTPNPNKSKFPIALQGKKSYTLKDVKVVEFISKSKLSSAEITKNGSKIVVLFDPKIGVSPVNL